MGEKYGEVRKEICGRKCAIRRRDSSACLAGWVGGWVGGKRDDPVCELFTACKKPTVKTIMVMMLLMIMMMTAMMMTSLERDGLDCELFTAYKKPSRWW